MKTRIQEFTVLNLFKKQNAKFPCFYVENQDVEQEAKLGARYYRTSDFTISFFLSELGEIDDIRAIQNVAEKLYWALEFVTLKDGSLIRGTNMKHEIVDDVLVFKVSYNYFILKKSERHPMQTLDLNEEVKNGN